MKDLKGKKIGITKSLNTIKNDWWRIQEHMGIENILMLNDMTMDDIELVEFPYPDDWYDKPEMLVPPMNNPSELWMRRDHKHDYAFRPLEKALLDGTVDAIYNQMGQFGQLSEATGEIKAIFDLSKLPDWTIQVANTPAVITCTDVMAKEHPELVIAYMKAMIKVGRWANEHKHAAAVILNRQTFYLDAEHTYEGHQARRHGAEPERPEPGMHQYRQGFHVQPRLHQERLRCERVGGPGVPGAGGDGSTQGRMGEKELEQTSSRRRARG